ncbi:MAG: DMT family transporter [Nitrospirae bacterium]|nr:DMT family transporter [Nitrospirota bacterium]MCL5237986.1 DMT family transporter [Nitrospirota bacterium]
MRTFVVILLATLCAAIGEALLSYGMKRTGEIRLEEPSQWLDLVLSVVRSPYVFIGVVFLGIFFFFYLAALSWADLSFVMPLTALSYIFAAALAKFVLKEDVSWYRWVGTVIIAVGIVFVALDSRQKSPDCRINGCDGNESNSETHHAEKERSS